MKTYQRDGKLRPSTVHADRLARVREQLVRRRLDGYLVWDRMDQYWLTGFTGEDGGVLVTAERTILLTDGRFDTTATLEAPWAVKVLRLKRGPESTAREIKRYRLRRVGFDPAHLNVATYAALGKLVRPGRLVSAGGVVSEMRQIKDALELAAIRGAIDIAQRAFAQLRTWLRPGMSERYVAGRLVFEMQQLGAQCGSFEPIVAVGASAALPHYEPGDQRVTRDAGVLIDWGARAGWYVSDLTRVLWPGSIPPRLRRIADVVREAHDRAVAVIGPGVKAVAVDRAARQHIHKAGLGKRFNHATGHGIGLNVHEAPRLGRNSKDVLKAGMVVTVEPGVYLPGVGGVRLESDVLVTERGHEVLSTLAPEFR
jgi:Xaa-Pro aminopeptidase